MAALLLCGAVLVVPLLLIQNGANAGASSDRRTASHDAVADPTPAEPPHLAVDVGQGGGGTPTTTTPAPAPTTTVPPTVTVPVETTLLSQNVASHATVVRPPTTTTVPPPPPPPTTTTTAPPPLPVTATGSVHYGQVTYYDHPAGYCASPFLPFGTVVRITNPANNASVSCVVNDREVDTARSIDLATSTFAEIAPLSQGVINATLSW